VAPVRTDVSEELGASLIRVTIIGELGTTLAVTSNRLTLSVTLREKHRVRVFEKGMQRRIFRSKEDEVSGGWIKLNNEELRDLYSSPSISRIMKQINR
jgi:hypothetical protein